MTRDLRARVKSIEKTLKKTLKIHALCKVTCLHICITVIHIHAFKQVYVVQCFKDDVHMNQSICKRESTTVTKSYIIYSGIIDMTTRVND